MRANVEPEIWGPSGWHFLTHCLEAYDASTRPAYIQLLQLLPAVLPCAKCRQHAAMYLVKHPPDDSDDLGKWLRDFRTAVAVRVASERRRRGSCVWWLVLIVIVAIGWVLVA
jgi:hypothetical protein